MSNKYYSFFNFQYNNPTKKVEKPNVRENRILSAPFTPRGLNMYRKVTDCSCGPQNVNTKIYKDSQALCAGQPGCFNPVIKTRINQRNKNPEYQGTIPNRNYNYSYHQYLSNRISYDSATCNSDLTCNIPSQSIVRGTVKYGTTTNPWPNPTFSRKSAVSSGNRLLKLKYDSLRCTPDSSNPNCRCPATSGSSTPCRGKYYGGSSNNINIHKKSIIPCESRKYLQQIRQSKNANC